MKKKLCGSLLLLAMLLGLLNFPAWAGETGSTSVLASGKCGFSDTDEPTNDVTWTLNRSGLLTVRGSGAMYDYASADSLPWYGYRNQITSAEVQSGVTTVGNNAFRTCANLESVKLPDGLISIGDVAFYHCDALAAIAIPDTVTTIGKNAFGYCALTTVSIPSGVTSIGEAAFFKCSKLASIEASKESATYSSEDGVLFDKIKTQETPEGEGEEGEEQEPSPDKSLLICYPMAKTASAYAIPAGVTKIGPYAFHSALKLEEVVAPDGLTEIGEWAFAYNAVLKKLTLPNTLTAVKDYAFYDCTGLSDDKGNEIEGATVTFKGSRQQWSALEMSPNGNNRLTNAKIIFEDMKQDNVVASGECGAYGSNASWSLKKLDEKGEQHELVISGSGAMSDYRSEASVPWTHYESAEEGAEPQDLREKITSVRIEGNLTNIGSYAFYHCDNLTTLTVETPSQLKTIGAYAFSDCAKLASMNLSQTPLVSIGEYAFSDNAALENVELPETLETVEKRAFMRSGLTKIKIPAAVTEIGDWAFRWCDKLASFAMEEPTEEDEDIRPDVSIGAYALADCAEMEKVSFSEKLMTLGDFALSNCPKLAGVDIPSGVSGIGDRAFYNCPAMAGVNVDEENQSYCSLNGMLLNKEQTCIFYYPMGRTSEACAISELVTSVTPFAFYGATNLKDVYYGGSQSQWDKVIKPNLVNTYNDPLLNATIYAEGSDDLSDDATTVDSFTVEETEEGRIALASVHCGENALGAEALCATYDKDGRFLGIESKELSPGTDEEISFALPDKADSLRLFVLDGNKSPCCPAEKWPESDEA